MGIPLYYSDTLQIITCGVCNIPHAIPSNLHDKALTSGAGWYCPNGHNLIFTETKSQRLEKELEQEKKRRTWAEEERDRAYKSRAKHERRASAYKGKVTLIKNRIGNGVCPCCNRTFQNLLNHMKIKHPDFKKETQDE